IAGGRDTSGQAMAQSDVWTPQTGAVGTTATPMSTARSGHTATLLGDGRVLLWDGPAPPRGDVFDPATAPFSQVSGPPPGPHVSDPPHLEASLPAAGTVDVSEDSAIGLRFSKPLRMDSVSEATVTLSGPQGPEPVRVVPVEGGRLAFVTPQSRLTPGSRYSLVVNGSEAFAGYLLPFTRGEFATAGTSPSTSSGATTAPTVKPGNAIDRAHHAGQAGQPGRPSELDELEWKGPRRDGKPYSRWQDLPPLQAPPGVTALA